MKPVNEISVFDTDAAQHGGYLYTKDAPLSAQMATQRTTDIILQAVTMSDCSILDLGCGDGFYTVRFFDRGMPRIITAVDAAPQAIHVARMNSRERRLQFVVSDARWLPFHDDAFDMVLIQSILHHSDSPMEIIRERLPGCSSNSHS
ncbi:MAG: class I SAM-dependent methyltransferase [Deltaproteobacteria bacterium]|nr:class I SAM-dependent methyltransferase [Deltaproteobacteria bacterium]